jgi:hypothetical protein
MKTIIAPYDTITNVVMFVEDKLLLSNDTFLEKFLLKSSSKDTYIFSFNYLEKEYLDEIAKEPQNWRIAVHHYMDYN